MDEVAFFRVTHIEHNLVQLKDDATPDTHFAAVMGELGCWFDPETTRLTQSGLENSRIPDLDEFLGISESTVLNININRSPQQDARTPHWPYKTGI